MTTSIPYTQPLLPPLAEYQALLTEIWDSKWLTNSGPKHQALEAALVAQEGVPCALYANATLGLMGALAALNLPRDSEVITTPFTFAATPHAIVWAGLKPVFVDVDPATLCLCPKAVAAAITSNTSAILGVHVYGMACAVEALQTLADNHNLKMIYDAAHAFGTQLNDKPLVAYGDASVCSFHATKLFNTGEGAAVFTPNETMLARVRQQKEFGKVAADTFVSAGFNAKMTEFHAALGLANLPLVSAERAARLNLLTHYKQELEPLGVHFYLPQSGVSHSGQYCAVGFNASACGATRDEVHAALNAADILSRKYFWPLCTDYPHFKNSAQPPLPVAQQAVADVLCLPFFGAMTPEQAQRVTQTIKAILTAT